MAGELDINCSFRTKISVASELMVESGMDASDELVRKIKSINRAFMISDIDRDSARRKETTKLQLNSNTL